jgi:hypothetical protein
MRHVHWFCGEGLVLMVPVVDGGRGVGGGGVGGGGGGVGWWCV